MVTYSVCKHVGVVNRALLFKRVLTSFSLCHFGSQTFISKPVIAKRPKEQSSIINLCFTAYCPVMWST